MPQHLVFILTIYTHTLWGIEYHLHHPLLELFRLFKLELGLGSQAYEGSFGSLSRRKSLLSPCSYDTQLSNETPKPSATGLLPVAQTLSDPILFSISFSLVRTTSRKISSTRSWLGNSSFQPPTGTTLQIPPRYCIGLFLCTLRGLACGAEQPQLGAPET